MKKSLLLGSVVAALIATTATSPALAKGAEVVTDGTAFYLSDTTSTTVAETTFTLADTGDSLLVGDFTGSGQDTVAVRHGNVYTFADGRRIAFGRDTDEAFVGDWNGDGRDTIALRRGNVFHITDTLGGTPERQVAYGRPTDTVYVGDWDGDGVDTVMVRRQNVNHFTNTFSGGEADIASAYGRPDDAVHVGDWDGNGTDTIMVRRQNVNHLKNDFAGGAADIVVAYGRSTDTLIIGNWTGAGATLGVVRAGSVPTTVSGRVGALPVPSSLVIGGLPASPARIGTDDGWYATVVPPASAGHEFTSISATEDYTALFWVEQARGMTVELQRSTDGGRTWQVLQSTRATSDYQHLEMTIPATRRLMTADYRLVIPEQQGYRAVVAPTTRLTHYLASGLPASDPRRALSDIVGPYCQNTPVAFDGGPDGWLYEETSSGPASGMAYLMPTMDLYEIHVANNVREYYNVWGDPWVTHVALHECAHVVAYRVLGGEYGRVLDQAYPREVLQRTGTNKDEAIANALAYHWAKNDPARNRAPAFTPTDVWGRTWMENVRAAGEQPWRTWVMDYSADDGLVDYLTREAMRRS